MLIVLSPAKKLDFESENLASGTREPRFMKETAELVRAARKLKAENLMAMMGISAALADLNVARFKAFSAPFTPTNARPAIDAFKGDVYVGLDAETLDDAGRAFADQHVRILSGLYGILKPLDLMQAYRLEMGTKFATDKGPNLYSFWGDAIARSLKAELAGDPVPVIVNLASGEYFKAVKLKALQARVVTPVFKEGEGADGKVISFMAKKARGLMTRYAIDNRIAEPEALKAFDREGYRLDESQSDADTWIFTRPRA